MPGGQPEIIPVYWDKFTVRLHARPVSWLRLIPLFGAAWIFRLGAKVSFRLEAKCVKVNEVSENVQVSIAEWEKENPTQRDLVFAFSLPNSDPIMLYLSVPDAEHKRASKAVGQCFLSNTGTMVVSYESAAHTGDLYAFEVAEVTFAAINWIIVIVAGALGGIGGYLLACSSR